MIKAHGNSAPKAFFIADCPAGQDLETGLCLTGSTGHTIREFCKEQSLNLDDFWRTALIKEPFPKDDDKELTKSKQLIEQYSPLLVEEIKELKPNLLIPLGEHSFNYLTNLNSIRKFRGSVLAPSGEFNFSINNLKVLPILGPNPYLNKEYRLRVISRIDFGKISKYLNNAPIPDDSHKVWVARSSSALREFFTRSYAKSKFLVFDIETFFQIPICISFCFDGYESVTVPLVDSSIDRDNRMLMLEMIDKLLRSPLPKVNQNIKYDWKILERWGFVVCNVVGCTMLTASTLYCEFPKNLGFLTSIYTSLPYFKDEGKGFDPEKTKRDRYYLYCAKDSLATHQIRTEQQKEVVELGVEYVDKNLVRVMPIYRRMEDRGIRIDEQQTRKLLNKYGSLFHIQELKCRHLLSIPYFNPLSPKQCRSAIFEELGYKKVSGMKTTESGEVSTDEDSLDLLAIYGDAERAPSTGPLVLAAIIGARKVHKVMEVLELHLHPDKRFRCEFNLAGTENGRTSAGETTDQLIYLEDGKIKHVNLGHSLQTIGKHGFMLNGLTYGKDLRSIFVPSYGYTFVEADLSGAEARVDQVLAGNFDMSIFNYPGIHKLTGSWLYDCAPTDIKKNTLVDGVDRYHMSKTVRHAAERNIKERGLAILTQRPLNECTKLLDIIHTFQPQIKQVFHREIIRALDAPGHCLVAPNGRRRDFFDRIGQGTYNEAISFLPQAIVSDQTKFHGIGDTFYDKTIYSWAHLLVEAHDGTLSEVKKGREMEFGRSYKKNIESTPIDFNGCTLKRDHQLVIPCDVAISENSWFEGDFQEVKDL